MRTLLIISVLLTILISCNNDSGQHNNIAETTSPFFEKIPQEKSGIDFKILIDEENLRNPFNYVNLYCGGGVSIGDINNDGLQDIFFTSNTGSSKLYLNKGELRFEDITNKAGISTTGWCTASTMADVNNDGWLDIYICRSYYDNPAERMNLFFMNNGDGSFTEKSKQLGLNDENYSIACSFFDYDRDGDLDLIVANHPRYVLLPAQTHYDYWNKPVPQFSNKLFRNDGNKFIDVTVTAGIASYGHSLGVNTSDYDSDGFPDIFITVDHDEPDYLFKNNGDGTFSNVVNSVLRQTSRSSMGIDAGDVNHDKYPDYVVAEMLSEDHFREKVLMDMTNIDRFSFFVDSMGYKYYQMHNFLHLNNGNNSFSDISQMAGVHKSDWSWSPLFFDFDNDSWQDLFLSNGYYKNILERDQKKELDSIMATIGNNMIEKNRAALKYTLELSVDNIPNYLFKNNGNLKFDNFSKKAGFVDPSISTGSAYGDLDNDGDLDLVVSNIGQVAFLYENKSEGNNFLRISASSHPDMNPIGSRIYITYNNELQSREFITTRGFQSSSEYAVHFGLGDIGYVDQIKFIWPDGKTESLNNVQSNQVIIIDYDNAKDMPSNNIGIQPDLVQVTAASQFGINYFHSENNFQDYDIQVLLPHKQSEYGPFPSISDINNDGLEDIYFPGPHQQMGRLYIQKPNGEFTHIRQKSFFDDRFHEDGKSVWLDVNSDNLPDLIVASTGYEFAPGDKLYAPRIYLNEGNNQFIKKSDVFGDYLASASCVKPSDIDGDGDMDIFIGGRLLPHAYPFPGTSALFVNDSKGNFENKIKELAPELEKTGMVQDALWNDLDKDGDQDLLIVGEWMPIQVWINEGGKFENKTSSYFKTEQKGWWNTIHQVDLDNDGNNEFVVGNLGLNYKYKASDAKPFTVYAKDFDDNGTSDIALGTYYGEHLFPVRGKTCSTQQLPEFKNEYKTYSKYASLELPALYGDRLDGALKYEVNQFESIVIQLNAEGQFEITKLPNLAQISPVNGIVSRDMNDDGLLDLIIAGNLYQSEIETGRADAGNGLILINKGDMNFEALKVKESGLYLPYDVKSLSEIMIGDKYSIIAGINNKEPRIIQMTKPNI